MKSKIAKTGRKPRIWQDQKTITVLIFKAELEVHQLHAKINHISISQIHKIYEIQEMQLDYLEKISDLLESLKKLKHDNR